MGPGAARNKGIEAAMGTYIAFLDADDRLMENSLLERMELLNKTPEIKMVFSDYFIYNREGAIKNNPSVLKEKNFVAAFDDLIDRVDDGAIIFKRKDYEKMIMFSPYPICTNTVMLRKEIITKIGYFRNDISIGEDTDYWSRIWNNYKIAFIDKPLAVYNLYINNSLTKNKEKYCLDRIKYYQLLYDESKIGDKVFKKLVGRSYYQLGYYYFNSARCRFARQYFLKDLNYNPFRLRSYKYYLLSFLPAPIIMYLKNIKTWIKNRIL